MSSLQDCGHAYYLENYIAFYAAIKSRYPNIQLIANCNLDGHAPTEVWDWYVIATSDRLFHMLSRIASPRLT